MAGISDVADPSLAPAGEERIAWAEAGMPVLAAVRARFAADRPLDGVVVAGCLHVTAETGVLVRTLAAGGADVGLAAANPFATRDDVAAALATGGARIHAVHGEDRAAFEGRLDAMLARPPHVTLDDGADLVSLLHGPWADRRGEMIGGTEETATGVLRVRALDAEHGLAFPVLAVNETATTRVVESRCGTGQSTLDGILRATNILLAGRTVAVLGYGPCGRGVAERSRGAGAEVLVCEVDPLRALEARMDGFGVVTALAAAARADVVVTATGDRAVIGPEHAALLRDGAILCNAGHFDVEIDVPGLRALAVERRETRPLVEELVMEDGRRIVLLAGGRVVNLAAAEGHPPAVMDVAFAVQALAVEHLVRDGGTLAPGLHPAPAEIDREVARLQLAAMGVEIDDLRPDQERYLRSWRARP